MQDLNETSFAVVAKVLDAYKAVINRGRVDGVKIGQRFLFYKVEAEEIIDPVTKRSLGKLELVKGTGKVTHVQEHMCTIESDKSSGQRKTIVRKPLNAFLMLSGDEQIELPEEVLPFDDLRVGDQAKPI